VDKPPIIGVIGMGFVGGAVFRGFSSWTETRGYDIDERRRTHSLEEVLACDLIFVCLPTPMPRPDGGAARLDIIHDAFKLISETPFNPQGIFVLKSTVPVWTTNELADTYGLRLIHNPEFLTAKNADIDFLTPSRVVLGGPIPLIEEVGRMYAQRFPGVSILLMTASESEAVKYVSNCFLAVKVLFFNEMSLGMARFGLDWERVIEGVLSDGRIGRSHYSAPGDDGVHGFSGSCFPKDIAALIEQLHTSDFDPLLLKATWEQNKRIRPEMDWFP
jgi:UDPglucose 6-dehydrogenase